MPIRLGLACLLSLLMAAGGGGGDSACSTARPFTPVTQPHSAILTGNDPRLSRDGTRADTAPGSAGPAKAQGL